MTALTLSFPLQILQMFKFPMKPVVLDFSLRYLILIYHINKQLFLLRYPLAIWICYHWLLQGWRATLSILSILSLKQKLQEMKIIMKTAFSGCCSVLKCWLAFTIGLAWPFCKYCYALQLILYFFPDACFLGYETTSIVF